MSESMASKYSIQWINKIATVPKEQWDALALPLPFPFFEWTWLENMESSGSTTAKSGWLPSHLTVWKEDVLVAAAPLYIKGHSYGEFVFDHQWADLAYRLGVEYYPKLLGMSPFTPAEGYRFMVAESEDEYTITSLMVSAIDHFCDRHNISGCNFLYVDPAWRQMMMQFGYAGWLHHSFIWKNDDFGTFDDYLQSFNANQRRNIKRERKAIAKAGLDMRVVSGDEIPNSFFSKMYEFYSDTCDKFGWWGSKYLTQSFFEKLSKNFKHRVVFVTAHDPEHSQNPVGMSFCLTKGDRLYGRYWGSTQEVDCLHFNACYYAPIEWAIANNIQWFDPGAGGRHKKRRGFPARPHYSLHRFYDNRLSQILQGHIDEINQMEQHEIDRINEDLPFRQGVSQNDG
ncbi:MAG: GNAT family N-acetyltransferase [Cyanobacteria bacterium P01_E01_bin.6]